MRRVAWVALAAVALAVVGGPVLASAHASRTSGSAPVVASVDSHPATAVAERLSERVAPAVLRLLFTSVAVVAFAIAVGWVTRALTDRRSLAVILTLHCRHRGPPALFTV